MKTNKHQTLLLVKKEGGVRALDLVQQFAYSSGTARSYLSYLARQDLLERTGRGYALTQRGLDRLEFFSTSGCDNYECPHCQGKRAGYFCCPRCGYRLTRGKARLRPERNFLMALRPAGVYCPLCLSQILTEKQARLIEIPEEAK